MPSRKRHKCGARLGPGRLCPNDQRDFGDGFCDTHHAKSLRLTRTYGISLVQVEEILSAQGWLCPVGGEMLPGEDWVIDHDHKQKIIRGVLCRYHNHRVVGRHTDGNLLIRAGEYLNDPPAPKVLGTEPTVPKKKRKRRRTAAPKKEVPTAILD